MGVDLSNDKAWIEHILRHFDFDLAADDKNLIQFVDMCEYGVASQEKPLLLTMNLQSCIALIAHTRNFSFLAHMNVCGSGDGKDFDVDANDNVVSCKKVESLYNEILKNKEQITEPISIGLVLGIMPVRRDHAYRQVIERDLREMIRGLRANNVSATRVPDISSWTCILDSRTGEIMHDKTLTKKKPTIIGGQRRDSDIDR